MPEKIDKNVFFHLRTVIHQKKKKKIAQNAAKNTFNLLSIMI